MLHVMGVDSGRATGPDSSIDLHSPSDPFRPDVEAFVEGVYAQAFDGRIRRHYPLLMSLRDRAGRILAAAGFRHASDDTLFLEQYLDEPVETAIGRVGFAAPREAIVEIGGLASACPGAALTLFRALARHLDEAGCTHAVATATRQLRRGFSRAGLATRLVVNADPARLGDGARDWGGYYDRDPQVLAGAIAPASLGLAYAPAELLRRRAPALNLRSAVQ